MKTATAGKNTICHGCFTFSGRPVRWVGNEEVVEELPCWSAVTDNTTVYSYHGIASYSTMGKAIACLFSAPVDISPRTALPSLRDMALYDWTAAVEFCV